MNQEFANTEGRQSTQPDLKKEVLRMQQNKHQLAPATDLITTEQDVGEHLATNENEFFQEFTSIHHVPSEPDQSPKHNDSSVEGNNIAAVSARNGRALRSQSSSHASTPAQVQGKRHRQYHVEEVATAGFQDDRQMTVQSVLLAGGKERAVQQQQQEVTAAMVSSNVHSPQDIPSTQKNTVINNYQQQQLSTATKRSINNTIAQNSVATHRKNATLQSPLAHDEYAKPVLMREDDYKKEIASLKAQNQRQRCELKVLSERLSAILMKQQSRLATMHKSVPRHRGTLRDSTSAGTGGEELLLQRENDNLHTRLQQLTKENATLKRQVDMDAVYKVYELENLNKDKQNQLALQEKELKRLQRENKDLERHLEEMQTQKNAAQAPLRLDTLLTDLDNWKDQVRKLKQRENENEKLQIRKHQHMKLIEERHKTLCEQIGIPSSVKHSLNDKNIQIKLQKTRNDSQTKSPLRVRRTIHSQRRHHESPDMVAALNLTTTIEDANVPEEEEQLRDKKIHFQIERHNSPPPPTLLTDAQLIQTLKHKLKADRRKHLQELDHLKSQLDVSLQENETLKKLLFQRESELIVQQHSGRELQRQLKLVKFGQKALQEGYRISLDKRQGSFFRQNASVINAPSSSLSHNLSQESSPLPHSLAECVTNNKLNSTIVENESPQPFLEATLKKEQSSEIQKRYITHWGGAGKATNNSNSSSKKLTGKRDFRGNAVAANRHFKDEDMANENTCIVQVTLWSDAQHLSGVQFHYGVRERRSSDSKLVEGRKHVYEGEKAQNYVQQTFDFRPDYLKSIKCSLSVQGYLEGVILRTSKNKEFSFGNLQNAVAFKIDYFEFPQVAFGGLMILEDEQQNPIGSILTYLGFEIGKDFTFQQQQNQSKQYQQKDEPRKLVMTTENLQLYKHSVSEALSAPVYSQAYLPHDQDEVQAETAQEAPAKTEQEKPPSQQKQSTKTIINSENKEEQMIAETNTKQLSAQKTEKQNFPLITQSQEDHQQEVKQNNESQL